MSGSARRAGGQRRRGGALGAALSFDTLSLTPGAGLRLAAVGSLAAILPGLTGHRALVPSAAIGALMSGIVALISPARVRGRATAVSSVLFAAVSLVGSLTFSRPVVYVALLMVLAFVAGALAQRGPPIAVLSLQSAVVYVALGQTVAATAGSVEDHLTAFAAVVFGGLLQWLAIVLNPSRFRSAERERVLAVAFRRMADHAALADGRDYQLPATRAPRSPHSARTGPTGRRTGISWSPPRRRG